MDTAGANARLAAPVAVSTRAAPAAGAEKTRPQDTIQAQRIHVNNDTVSLFPIMFVDDIGAVVKSTRQSCVILTRTYRLILTRIKSFCKKYAYCH